MPKTCSIVSQCALPNISGDPTILDDLVNSKCPKGEPISYLNFLDILEDLPPQNKTNAYIDSKNPLAAFTYDDAKKYIYRGHD